MEKDPKVIQASIKLAEIQIQQIIRGLYDNHGIVVVVVDFDETNSQPETDKEFLARTVDLRTTRALGTCPAMDMTNSTFEEWNKELELECAYCNISSEICGGEEDRRKAYYNWQSPAEEVRDQLDAAM